MTVALAAGVFTLLTVQTPRGGTAALSSPLPLSQLSDRGTFEITLAGKTIGTESFEIRSTDQEIEAQADIHLRVEQGGKPTDVKTNPRLLLDSQLQPVSYTWKQKGAQSSQLDVDFRLSPVQALYKTVNGKEELRIFNFSRDVVVLDDNVVHHYQLLVGRYLLLGGGHQAFQAFVPQEASPGNLTVQDAGFESPSSSGSNLKLRHLVVTSELARVNLWVDDQGRVMKVAIPEAQFEAARKK